MRWHDGRGANATNDMSNGRGEAESYILIPVLEQDVLTLVGEEDDQVDCSDGAREEEKGQEGIA